MKISFLFSSTYVTHFIQSLKSLESKNFRKVMLSVCSSIVRKRGVLQLALQFNWNNLFSTTLQFHYNYNHNIMLTLLIFIHPLKFDTWHNSKLPYGVLIEFWNIIYIYIHTYIHTYIHKVGWYIAIGKYVGK
jgi:hypothetical protein